jgi:sulfur carrier protein ThiS
VLIHVTSHPSSLLADSAETRSPLDVKLHDGAAVRDLLDVIGVHQSVIVAVNGKVVSDLAVRLRNDDAVKLVVPIAGG